jgi:hypothetical protein
VVAALRHAKRRGVAQPLALKCTSGSPYGFSIEGAHSRAMVSQFRDGLARRAVTFSPHSKANQAKIGKDVTSGG